MSISFHQKTFKSAFNTDSGEVGEQTLFHYQQQGNVVWAEYSGGTIVKGFLVAKVIENDTLDIRYEHINIRGEIKTGLCLSRPEVLPDGRIRLHKKWRWTSGNLSSGESIIEEIIQEKVVKAEISSNFDFLTNIMMSQYHFPEVSLTYKNNIHHNKF
jgi:hypothetical protein